ncbi:Major intrinsic protein [Homalodisca vitripennis]|nr:Major intrinsic protein [Homalodisca vitripennis]
MRDYWAGSIRSMASSNKMALVKDRVGLSELNDNKNNLGKALIAECVGTFVLNFFGCLSVMNLGDQSTAADLVLISLAFGLSVMAMVQGDKIMSSVCLKKAQLFHHYPLHSATLNLSFRSLYCN